MANTVMDRLRWTYLFLSMLTIEPYLFGMTFLVALKTIPNSQLIQDKICLFEFNLNSTYCHDLPHMTFQEDTLHRKPAVLAVANTFSIYQSLGWTIPGIVAGMFIGPWLDAVLKAKKFLLMAGAISVICETIILLFNVYFYSFPPYGVLFSLIPSAILGGFMAIYTSIYCYTTSTTSLRFIALRMAVSEVVNAVATPLGVYLGGQVLNSKPLLNGGQLYNYTAIYAIVGITSLVMLIWTIFMIDERRDTIEWHKRFDESTVEPDSKVQLPSDKLSRFDSFKSTHPLKLLFKLDNFIEMFRTLFKKRPGTVRLQLWLVLGVMTCFLVSYAGSMAFFYSFAQKIYLWNSENYSNAIVIEKIVNTLVTFISAPILIKVLNLRDATLVIIGCLAYFGQNLVRGLVLNEKGFYISIAPGCLGTIGSIGLRTYFSKLISVKEQGRAFTLMTTVDAIMPLISVVLFSQIFNATMNTRPGLAFIIIAAINFVPMMAFFWIYFFAKLPNLKEEVIVNDGDHEINDKSSNK